jgi:ABC-2 type transport system permease protein
MGTGRAALLIAGNDLRRRVRDRSVIIQGVVAPVLLAVIVGLAFGGGGDFEVGIAVVDDDGSELSTALVRGLLEGGGEGTPIRFREVPDATTARELVDDETVGAAIVVPPGFGAAVASGRAPTIDVVVDPSQAVAGEIATGLAGALATRVDTGRLAVATALEVATPAAPAELDRIARAASEIEIPIELRQEAPGGDWSPIAYFAPSMAMLFLFFTVGASARGLLTERREGTLARVRAAPVRVRAILLGKACGVFVLGLASMLTVWAVTSVVFGAHWGDPLGVLAIILGVVLAIGGVSTLVAGVATSEAQADSLTAVVAFSLALVGGNFISPGALPGVLEVLSRATPNGWALRALTDLEAGATTAADVVPVAVGLALVGVATGAVGTALSERRLVT